MATVREDHISGHIRQVSDEALEKVRLHAADKYAQMNSSQKEALREAARKVAIETHTLTDEFKGKTYKQEDIASLLAKHLSAERIKLIQDALTIPTYDVDIIKKSGNKYTVNLSRDGKAVGEGSRDLNNADDVIWAINEQYASIVVEVIMLVMSIVGIDVHVPSSVVEKATRVAVAEIEKNTQLQKDLSDFIKAWNASGSVTDQAAAIFNLVMNIFNDGGSLFMDIVKTLLSEMGWLEYGIAIAEVAVALIVAAYASGGVALIVQIALALYDTATLAIKIAKINTLKGIACALGYKARL